MKKYLSHFSAAYKLNIPNIDDVLGEKYTRLYSNNQIVDITVPEPLTFYRKKGQRFHLCREELPRGAVNLIDGKFTASPELVFLQLSKELDIHRLIFLGLQMCSYPSGKPSNGVTTRQKLENFLNTTSGLNGHKKATKALKYINDGSASLMESLLYMILTLPNTLGGFGLIGAEFNQEIILTADAQRELKQKRCFADLYYSNRKIDIEYDSFTHHQTPHSQSKDLRREAALKNMGIDVLRIGTAQLYDENSCRNFAQILASAIGKRIRIRTERFQKMHCELRQLLPRRMSSLKEWDFTRRF